MKQILTVLLCLCALSASAVDMSHEETTVRTAYARLAYAVDIDNVFTAATHPDHSTSPSLRFTLSNFTVGRLSDIAQASFIDRFPVIDETGEEIIHTSVHTVNWSEGEGKDKKSTSMEALQVHWGPPSTPEGPNGTAHTSSVEQMIPILEKEWGVPGLRTYCLFTVTASLAGRSRTYQAVFFFDDSGHAAPLDQVVGQDGNNLEYFLTHPVFPSVLRDTKLAQQPAVSSFLVAGPKRASCKAQDACCDVQTLRCGIGGH